MKVCIIGIDGLDYYLVKKWDLKNLKQKEYGKVKIPIDEKLNEANTPQIWGSFLTGKIQKLRWKSKGRLWGLLTNIKHGYLDLNWGILKFLSRFFSEKDKELKFPKLDQPTFLDEVNSDYYNVPFYDYSKIYSEVVEPQIRKLSSQEITLKEFKNFLETFFRKNKQEMLKRVKKSKADLFFGYFHFLDLIQHTFYKDVTYIREKYIEMDRFVKEIKKVVGRIPLFLIIADHGHINGKHTNYGFYSASKELKLKSPSITDFYDIILEKVKLPTRQEREKIIKRFKKLGYFSLSVLLRYFIYNF